MSARGEAERIARMTSPRWGADFLSNITWFGPRWGHVESGSNDMVPVAWGGDSRGTHLLDCSW
jgi:hypothetical protein